jgi:hypothetical protein
MAPRFFLGFVIRLSPVQQKSSPGEFREKTSRKGKPRVYGVGEASAGDSVVPPVEVDVPVEDSVVEAGLVASVVDAGGLVAAGLAAGSVVSVFCSHAARSAALARMQIYFFIVLIRRVILL